MALGSGLASQLGFGDESTVGTFATPTRFLDYVSESLTHDISRIESKGLRAGRRTRHVYATGIESVSGDINLEFAAEDSGLLLTHMFGAVSTAGGGDPYTHTYTPGDLSDDGLTIQVGKPDVAGTVHPFSFLGCKVTDWTFSAKVDEFLMLRAGIYAQTCDLGQSLASASYDATWEPFTFAHGYIEYDSVEIPVKSFNLNGNNGLTTGRHRIRSTNPTRPLDSLEGAMRRYEGSLVADFTDLTHYNQYLAGSEASLVLTFDRTADDRSLIITMNARFDGTTPQVGGPDLLELPLKFDSGSTTADASAITVALENGDATP